MFGADDAWQQLPGQPGAFPEGRLDLNLSSGEAASAETHEPTL